MDRKRSTTNKTASRPVRTVSTSESQAGKQRAVVTRPVPAASRVIAILRLLGRSSAPMGVHAVASALGLIPSTCLHILRVLVAEELVAFDSATKRYELSAGILSIAGGVLRQSSFSDLAQPVLDGLSAKWASTAIGVEAVGLKHMVVVAISRMEQGLRLRTDIGSRFPALISSTGRCIAAFGSYPSDEIKMRFGQLRWDNPPQWEIWHSEVEQVRQVGYAVDDGNYIFGVTTIAAPVFSPAGLRNALVIVGVSERLRRFGYATVGEELKRRADELSAQMGGIRQAKAVSDRGTQGP
jgi:DNA-binding IclR family transcriptional regulator